MTGRGSEVCAERVPDLFEIMHLTEQPVGSILGFKEIGHDDPAQEHRPSLLP